MAYLEDARLMTKFDTTDLIAKLDETCSMLGLAPTFQIFYDEHTGADGWNVPYSKETYHEFIKQIKIGEHEKKYNGADRKFVVWIIMVYFGVKHIFPDANGDMFSDCAWNCVDTMVYGTGKLRYQDIGKSSLSGRDRIIHPHVRHNIKLVLELQKKNPDACFTIPFTLQGEEE